MCANKTSLNSIGTAIIELPIGNRILEHQFHVMVDLVTPCIIGCDLMKRCGITIDVQHRYFYFNDDSAIKFPFLTPEGLVSFLVKDRSPGDFEHGSYERQVEELLAEYPEVTRLDGSLGRTNLVKHDIEVEGKPIKEKPRIWPPHLAAEIEKQTQEMLRLGLIEPSKSPWGFNVALAKKSDGKWRLAVNYKKLNRITEKTATPIHNAHHILRLLSGGSWFSKLDLRSGYWQVELTDRAKPLTAWYSNGKLYNFRVMPFGLSEAPGTFVALMNVVFDGYIHTFVFPFFDDAHLRSISFQEHLEHLRKVLDRLKEANLVLNMQKSAFARRQVEFLGYIITKDGIRKDPEKLRPIVDYPRPQTREELQRFLGMCAYYATFIKHYAMKAEPLYRLTSVTSKFLWLQEQENAFNCLKNAIGEDVVLTGIDYKYPITLKCDASDSGLGSVLSVTIDGKERPIAFASRTLFPAERKLSTAQIEALAISFALNKNADLLWGEEFTIFTDSKAISYIKANMNGKDRRVNKLANLLE